MSHSNFAMGTGAFTIEAWVKFTKNNEDHGIYHTSSGANQRLDQLRAPLLELQVVVITGLYMVVQARKLLIKLLSHRCILGIMLPLLGLLIILQDFM